MENRQQLVIPCSTKCKMLASYLMYLVAIASPFGITLTGYSFVRAGIAGMILTVISAPAWVMILRKKSDPTEKDAWAHV